MDWQGVMYVLLDSVSREQLCGKPFVHHHPEWSARRHAEGATLQFLCDLETEKSKSTVVIGFSM